MKRFAIILLLIIGILNGAAQIPEESSEGPGAFDYGLHFGPAFSGLTHYREIFSGYRTGLTAGLYCEYHLFPLAGLSLEANYSTIGGSGINPGLIYPETFLAYRSSSILRSSSDLTLRTLEIPLMVNIRPVRGNLTPVVSIGYSLDYFLRAVSNDMVTTNGSYIIPLSYRNQQDVTSNFKRINQSIVFGAGLEFPVSKFSCSIQARYKAGLMNISGLSGLKYINHQYDFSVNTFALIFTVKMNNLLNSLK
jgi:hypothetical protein